MSTSEKAKLLLRSVDDGPYLAVATLEKHSTSLPGHEPPAELRRFRLCLRWMCINHGNVRSDVLSWLVFFILAVAVPAKSHFMASRNKQSRRSDAVLQVALSATAALSFTCLREFSRKHELQKFMTLDMLCSKSKRVRTGYKSVLNWFSKSLRIIIISSFYLEVVYRIWWSSEHFALCEDPRMRALLGTLELISWIYRSTIFVFLCLLYAALCKLEFLRLEEFSASFKVSSEDRNLDRTVIIQHRLVRDHLRTISRNFRYFLLSCHLIAALFLLAMVSLIPLDHFSDVSVMATCELALRSITILAGVLMSLYYTTKVTNKAGWIAADAANWHISSTFQFSVPSTSDKDDPDLVRGFQTYVDYPKRKEIVSYLKENKAGITVFGYSCDDTRSIAVSFVKQFIALWFLEKMLKFKP